LRVLSFIKTKEGRGDEVFIVSFNLF
jgi:hypothetical protein